ncbi:MAG: hypothetical protein KJS73_06365 [Gammaproteobacteria bacterium]|nr:hypothetical protein [Gammaproteobacteria bacterium]
MKFAQKLSKSLLIMTGGLMTLPVFAADPPVPGSAAPASTSAAASTTPSATTPAAVTTPASATPVAAKTEDKTPKVKCREEKVTGSSFRTRKVCTTTESQNGSGEWVREQQQRGSIGASAILNGGGG